MIRAKTKPEQRTQRITHISKRSEEMRNSETIEQGNERLKNIRNNKRCAKIMKEIVLGSKNNLYIDHYM